MRAQFGLRDLMFGIVIASVAFGWAADHRQLASEIGRIKAELHSLNWKAPFVAHEQEYFANVESQR